MSDPSDTPGPAAATRDNPSSGIIASRRLESFSDGVMAVIISVMAFNL